MMQGHNTLSLDQAPAELVTLMPAMGGSDRALQRKKRRQAAAGAWISAVAYFGLTFVKLVVGYTTGSLSLQADGFNNVSDVLATVAVLAGLHIARRPRDENHPYGHSRVETLASLVVSFIMMAIGAEVLIGAGSSLIRSEPAVRPSALAAWTALGSAFVMFAVYAFNRQLAQRTGSGALRALATDNLCDALVSAGAFSGAVGAHLNLAWLDPAVAVVIGIVICRAALEIFREASTILTDGFDEVVLADYRTTVLSVPGVRAVRDLRARSMGNDVVVDVTIQVNPSLTVADSHRIADAVELEMRRRHQVHATQIHIEPHTGN